MKCPACDSENPAGAKFCNECASPLSIAASALPDAPPASASPQGERKVVTVLFADVSGFTALSEALDPEAARNLITACFDHLVPCIEQYGGTIDKFVGDEIMALFGAPRAHENDPERALRAALEMRAALTAFNQERSLDLALHLGINTGVVFAGAVGGGGREDYSVMGDAVNVAARLRAAAGPGEILVGVDTRRRADKAFDWREARQVPAKGRSAPVVAHLLLGARPSGSRSSWGSGISSPLVGRETELAAFEHALADLRGGEGGILLLTGDAGLGKSRLVAEARRAAHADGGPAWLEGRTLSFGRTISYWPFLEIIQQDAGIGSEDDEGERWDKLYRRVGELFADDAAEVLPYLATLLNLRVPEELAGRVRHLDGEAVGRQVYRATRLYFARRARERPTVVVFEDVHWLDGSSAALLEHLLPLTAEAALLFCFVSRPELQSPLARLRERVRADYPDRLTEVALDPLSVEESATLAKNLVRLENLPTSLRGTILEKAEGNPLFLEEVVRTLVDQGGIVADDSGGWRVAEGALRIPIPDTLHGVIMARVDRLDEDLKQVLRLASVVGRSFFYRVLGAVADADQELEGSLGDLETRELIRERSRVPELEYVFKHALVQEATYESVLLQRRRELHARVAAAIEALFADRLEEFYSLLAYHYSRAEDWERAQDYLFKAGDQAGSIAADTEALAHYEQAVSAYTKAFGDTWDPFERATLERKMGEALYRRGEHERAREYLLRALATLGHPFPESRGAVRRALASQLLRQAGHRLLPWTRRPAAAEAKRVAEERCRIHLLLQVLESWGDQTKLSLHVLISLNEAEGNGLQADAAVASSFAGMICGLVGLRRLALSYLQWGMERAERSDSEFSLAYAHWMMGVFALWPAGDWEGAAEHFDRGAYLYRQCGDIRGWATMACVSAHPLVERGGLVEALAVGREVRHVGREAGDPFTETWGQAWEGEILYMMGDLSTGEKMMRSSVAAQLEMMDYRIGAKVAGHLAHCLLDQGRLDEARILLDRHLDFVETYGIKGGTSHYLYTADVAAKLMAAERAEGAARRDALEDAERACRALLKFCKVDSTSWVPACRMRGTCEWLRGRSGKARKWWDRSLAEAERRGARWERALARLEIGRRIGDRAQLEFAEAEFAAMGAAFYRAEARRLLGCSGDGAAETPLIQ